ncbi:MAG: 3-isopropylmalate dehydratase small subunit [Dehalococcoidia bacterium]|nr:MAG: 3-isopropylmalate dehydratase small subunit [Dehalococcoidia bacterium]
MLRGKALKYGDSISTDHIQPGRYNYLRSNLTELATHAFEDVDSSFISRVRKGDFVVAGKNFGLGSSREHAPIIIKLAGVSAVLAKSAARIFFRNAINVGLPVLICDTDRISDGDDLEVDLESSIINDLSNGVQISFNKIPVVMLDILNEGGLVPYINKYGDYRI